MFEISQLKEKKLTELLISEITPVGKEIQKLLKDKSHLKSILKKGTEKANIIAEAGKVGMITIATNMAGRGTDIQLGGNKQFLIKSNQNTEKENEENDDTQDQNNSNNNEDKDNNDSSKATEDENISQGIDSEDDVNEFRLEDQLGSENSEDSEAENIIQKKR